MKQKFVCATVCSLKKGSECQAHSWEKSRGKPLVLPSKAKMDCPPPPPPPPKKVEKPLILPKAIPPSRIIRMNKAIHEEPATLNDVLKMLASIQK